MKIANVALNKTNGFLFFMGAALVLAVLKIVFHLHFVALPAAFFLLGLGSYLWRPQKALYLFLFLLPLVGAGADFFFNGYPYNYMGIPLFYLCGLILAAIVRRRKLDFSFNWAGTYLVFLTVLWLSALFVALRWSNLTLPSLAFGAATPVSPSGELTSFASVFPVVALFLFSVGPFLPVLLRHEKLPGERVFRTLLYGYGVSFGVGLYQKFVDPDFMAISWWGEKLDQYNGGFSDFNAFGFFSGAMFFYLVVFSVQRFADREQKIPPYAFPGLLITLAGIFLSGCRTAFLFILLACLFLLLTKKIKLQYKIVSLVLVVVLILAAGGTLKKRMQVMLDNAAKLGSATDVIDALDKVSNGRIEMMKRSLPIIRDYPLTGLGSGNFLFFLKYYYLGEQYWEDLPLNQYLLILDETGLIGLGIFLFFLYGVMRQKRGETYRYLLAAMLVAVFFNFFFWFPEIFLLFWAVTAFYESEPPLRGGGRKWRRPAAVALVAVFVIFNIVHFNDLHPRTWAKNKGKEYSYGFWYPEKTASGAEYRWTKAKAGTYVYLDEAGKSGRFKITCGAPLGRLPQNSQRVDLYWRGKLFRRVVFKENRDEIFFIKDTSSGHGFLELRVDDVFNLKKLGISPESRDLGVQFSRLSD